MVKYLSDGENFNFSHTVFGNKNPPAVSDKGFAAGGLVPASVRSRRMIPSARPVGAEAPSIPGQGAVDPAAVSGLARLGSAIMARSGMPGLGDIAQRRAPMAGGAPGALSSIAAAPRPMVAPQGVPAMKRGGKVKRHYDDGGAVMMQPMNDMTGVPAMCNGGKVKGFAAGGLATASSRPMQPDQSDFTDRLSKPRGMSPYSPQDRVMEHKPPRNGAVGRILDPDRDTGDGDDMRMAKGGHLDTAARKALPRSDFALPGKGAGPSGKGSGSYPIPDRSHAANALSRVSQFGSSAEKAAVRAKVHAKYPDMGKK